MFSLTNTIKKVSTGLMLAITVGLATFGNINLGSKQDNVATNPNIDKTELTNTTIKKQTPTQEVKSLDKGVPIIITNNNGKTEVKIDKNLIKKDNTEDNQASKIPVEANSKPKTILPGNISFGIGEPAQAFYKRNTYKISSISKSDLLNFCKSKFPNSDIKDASRYAGKYLECFYSAQYRSYHRDIQEICEERHPGYGTWVGDGGYSCYDSYRTWY
jgi:hypothetical protein